MCSTFSDSLHFLFSPLSLLDADSRLKYPLNTKKTYQEGDVASYDVVIPRGRTSLDPPSTLLFQELDIWTKISRGKIEVVCEKIIPKGNTITDKEAHLLGLLNVYQQATMEILFVIQEGEFIPARYAAPYMQIGLAEACMNANAVSVAVNWPNDALIPSSICQAFINVISLSSVNDDLLLSLNEKYVDAFTEYAADLRFEKNKAVELEKIETTLKPLVTEFEAEIAKLREDIELFDNEYKNVKANFEDQDFKFTGLQVTVTPYQEKIHISPGSSTIVPVLIEIKIGQADLTRERTPFNLAIVLDRSGSMQGDKLTNCKSAINNIIDKMIDDDSLHLIVYDDQVDKIFVNGKKSQADSLKKKVDYVFARNTTNISGGLEMAETTFQESTSTHHKRTFLFSDGQANCGMTQPAQLGNLSRRQHLESEIVTSSFGIGSDFNFEIMDTIAKNGHGSYFFIDESHNIPKLVEKGLRGLTSLLATNAVLKIKNLPPGVQVKKVYGHNTKSEILVGDMRYGDLKQTLLDLEIDSSYFSHSSSLPSPVLSFDLDYCLQEREDQGATFLPIGPVEKVLSLIFTNDRNEVDSQQINYEVEVTKVIKEAAELDAQSILAFKNHDVEKAIQLKRTKMECLEKASYHDRYGFTRVLLQKTRKSLLEFLLDGLNRRVANYNQGLARVHQSHRSRKASNYTSYSSAHAVGAKSKALFDKQLAYVATFLTIITEAMEEECDDMGFGLFD